MAGAWGHNYYACRSCTYSSALDTICMEGSDDELGLEEVEVVENPYHNHAAEFEDCEELEATIVLH